MLAVLVPVVILAAVELGLRLFGFGYSTHFFVPAGKETVTTNRRFLRRFMRNEATLSPHPVVLAARKPPGTLRIFVLGESAAQGTPAPAFGFARILEAMLQQQFPERRFEVVNAALRGVNSHIILPIARDCADLAPDLYLVYVGNNESIGLYAPEPSGFNVTPYRRLLHGIQDLKGLRLAQGVDLLARRISKPPPKPEQDMDFFRKQRMRADDPRRGPVYDNFRSNLDEICRKAQGAGAKTLLSTVAVNLGDFPPLASLHRPGLAPPQLDAWQEAFGKGTNAEARGQMAEAITNFVAALTVDPGFADLHYRLGRCQLALGRYDEARESFAQARDWDALMFRTDRRINQAIREIAASRPGSSVYLVDVERALAEAAREEHGIPGSRFFHDHVHLTFDGDYALASAFLPAVTKALGLEEPAGQRGVPTRAECAAALGLSPWDELGLEAAMVRASSKPPFLDQLDHTRRQAALEAAVSQRTQGLQQRQEIERSLETYRRAIERRPQDWQIRYSHGNLLNDFGQRKAAIEEYTAAVGLMPSFPPLRVALAQALWLAGDRSAAVDQLREALRIDPDYLPARDALSKTGRQPDRH